MSATKTSILVLTAFAGLAAVGYLAADAALVARRSPAPAPLTRDGLVDHSLVFADTAGQEQVYYFGRFGNFDWYFPCEFESGSWTIDADRVLHLTYDNPDFAPRELNLSRNGGGLTVADARGRMGPTAAEIAAENRLPFG